MDRKRTTTQDSKGYYNFDIQSNEDVFDAIKEWRNNDDMRLVAASDLLNDISEYLRSKGE